MELNSSEKVSFPAVYWDLVIQPRKTLELILAAPPMKEALLTFALVVVAVILKSPEIAKHFDKAEGLPAFLKNPLGKLFLLSQPVILMTLLVPASAHTVGKLLDVRNRTLPWKPVLTIFLLVGTWVSLLTLVPSRVVWGIAQLWTYVIGALTFVVIYRFSWIKSLLAVVLTQICFLIAFVAAGMALVSLTTQTYLLLR